MEPKRIMSKPERQRRIEREFGVPIPGELKAETEWTKTALKSLPPAGTRLNWPELFGRTAPVVLDLGCGNGRSTLSSAVIRPGMDHLGVDILPVVIRYATRRANQRGLPNVRFAVIGGRELLAHYVAPGSVAEIHCFHPQPYYTPQEVPKRLITPEFLMLVHRSLQPGGTFIIQTDHPAYWNYMRLVIPAFFQFTEHPGRWSDAPKGKTRREILAIKQNLPVFRGTGIARSDISPDEAMRRVESLPAPLFDADRRLQQLDRLERE